MRIIFIKSCLFNRRHRAIGTITTVTPQVAARMISNGTAREYIGAYPPTGKIQTDFFKPKDI